MKFFQSKVAQILVSVIILVGVFFSGIYTGSLHATSSSSQTTDLTLFWKAWDILNQKYVKTHASSTDSTDGRVYGAIKGMVDSLGDPYTTFFPPEDNKFFQSEISGNFEGVGMEVGIRDGLLTVISPLKGTPAEKAGIKSGDIILKIDTTVSDTLRVDEAVKLIRGKKGTTVTLTLFRKDKKEPLVIKVVRDTINSPTVETEKRSDGIFVIHLYTFTQDSPTLFQNAIKDFVNSGDTKMILDLRGNPGGYLEAAVDMASWFLPEGDVVVTEEYGDGRQTDIYRSKGYNLFNKKLKMVVLVDGGSASASEILSGALSEHGVATLVGTKTFGKGSVQELINLTPDTSLKVTVARWLTPKGKSISDTGITPDVIVPVTDKDITAKVDPQIKKAVEILNQK